ncbi:SPOR domain-containing protein [Shewanella schlegeliana]|uniref:SPOR domain-containing protein n=1 Tax=Shewanella schlegeliana TaxID=190308 RepID=A0ABS1SXB3_9GAMM|nr:SPOR domain-containing protein [Shewanella schlegeliana]MBL4913029.1 SPOR domain-containing protein [Shewanella schlegeliana]MCL1108875.1 SPOR domain-containing protein [Shewanella schlegeliana]GIU23891.1 cell division protein FtsN [Shewanella schlegeliana]
MTNRDYANRKPARKGKNSARKKSSKGNAPKRFPILLLLITLTGLGGFGYLLWTLSSSDEPTPAPVVVEQPEKKPVKKDPNALPPVPKEEWTYLEELENKKVEVDIPDTSDQPKRPYQMQCGSFRKESQANELKAIIAFQGLEAQVRKVKGSSGIWYKVVLGPYDKKRDAERQRHVLQNGGTNGCQIWFWES